MTLREQLESIKGEPVTVLSHARPDADAIGSQVGLCLVLQSIGAQVVALNADPIPSALQELANLCPIEPLHSHKGQEALKRNKLILVDCSDPERVEPGWTPPPQGVFLNIDHHLSNTRFAKYNEVDVEAAATAQILSRELLKSRWMQPNVAQAFYIGILADTVGFQSSSTNADVFDTCRQLCAAGADPGAAAHALFYQERFEKMKLLAGFLATLEHKGPLCIGTLPHSLKNRAGAIDEDSEGFVQYPLRIQGIDVSALIEETQTGLKGSLRSRSNVFRVDQLAAQFGGGGHACAAGFRINAPSCTAFLPLFTDKALSHIKNVSDL